jgi:glycosyltransferase involved in cell wall biosynthesis
MSVKVLIVYHAGAAATARPLYPALARAGDLAVTVAVPRRLRVDPVYDLQGWLTVDREETESGYRLVPIPLRDPSDYWRGFEVRPLRRVMAETKPDIIHVLDEPTSGYVFQVAWHRLSASPRSKVLFYGFDNLPIRLSRRATWKWKLTWGRMAGGAAANSEALENVKRAGFPPDRPLERIFWGVAKDAVTPMDGDSSQPSLDLAQKDVVGFVGRLVPEKGVHLLLTALQQLPHSVHFLIVGDGPMRSELEAQANRPELKGRVHFTGVVGPAALKSHMRCMRALAVPSLTTPRWKEQYGRVIGEAMCCAVPVIGSDSGAIPEVIGSAGIIVPEGEPRSLAEALGRVLFDADLRDRLIRQGLQRAQEELSMEAMATRLVGLYTRVLGG